MCLSNSPKIHTIDAMYSDASKDLNQILDSDSFTVTKDSNYVLPENADELNAIDYELKVLHLNIHSLPAKIDELKFLINKLAEKGVVLDIILLCETFLSNLKNVNCEIDGYSLVERHRTNTRGGGVAVLVKNGIKYKELDDLTVFSEGLLESLFLEINLNKQKIIIAELYRVPGTDLEVFFEHYQDMIRKLQTRNLPVIIGTDQNLDFLKINEHSNTNKFFDMNLDAGLVPMITRPTRITSTSATLIDNIYCSNLSHVKSAIVLSGISDHLPCCLFYGVSKKYKKKPLVIEGRKINEDNLLKIHNELSEIDWGVLENFDTDQAYKYFKDNLVKVIDTHAPTKSISISPKNIIKEKWMTTGLLKSSKICDKLYKAQLGLDANSNAHTRYVFYRNEFNRLKRAAKKEYYLNLLIEYKNDSKKLWGVLNKVIGKTRIKLDLPEKIKDENNLVISGNQAIADTFCRFFTSVGPKLARSIPKPTKEYDAYLNKLVCNKTFFMTPTDESEILGIIKLLPNKSSSGYDNISNILLKQLAPSICKPLCIIFNKSMQEGIFPQDMKLAEVVPIFKSKDRAVCTNYRPISLLPVMSKVLERVIKKRLYKFVVDNNLLYNSQYGFRNNHSTVNAISEFIGKILKGFEEEKCAISVFLDLSKAFDTIDHNILLNKLEFYGVRGLANQWFHSYLNNRWQQVKYIDGVRSRPLEVQCGVPQGSVLGPLLFVLYTNDIYACLQHSSCILFADDTTIFQTGKNIDQMLILMSQDMSIVTDWFRANKLSLNLNKTNCILFRPKNQDNNMAYSLRVGNEIINMVSDTKFLGLYIDKNLLWTKHINTIRGKLTSGVYAMNSVRNMLPVEEKRMLYMSLINCHLIYGLMLWGPMLQAGDKNKLIKQQKKAIRAIGCLSVGGHTAPVCKKVKILKLDDLIELELAKFMYKYVHKLLPKPLLKLFTSNEQVHNYNTRGRQDARTMQHDSNIFSRSFLARAPSVWTHLAHSLKQKPSVPSFIRNYKKIKIADY